jgi:hypothetical protein
MFSFTFCLVCIIASLLANSNYANHHHCSCVFMFYDQKYIFLIVSHHTTSLLRSHCHAYDSSHQACIVIPCDLALKSLYAYFIMSYPSCIQSYDHLPFIYKSLCSLVFQVSPHTSCLFYSYHLSNLPASIFDLS